MKKYYFIIIFIFYFFNIISEEQLKPIEADTILKLYQMLKDTHDIFKAYNIPYWIDGGTLLGAVRHKGLIPWDDDIDISILNSSVDLFLSTQKVFNKLGYEIMKTNFGYKIFYANGKTIRPYGWKYPFLDVFTAELKDNKIFYEKLQNVKAWRRDNLPIYYNYSELYPLNKYKFGEIKVRGPNNPYLFLFYLYGANYNNVACKWYDHKNELNIDKIRFNLDDKHKVPAIPTGPLKDNKTLIYDIKNQIP